MGKHSSAIRRVLIISSFIVLSPIVLLIIVEATGNHHEWKWNIPAGQGECRGTIGECMGAAGDQGEFDMDLESNRRILTTTKYISYGVLEMDFVPCSIKGTSYYNCLLRGQANPYTRGCSAITKCRS
ncbi:rapid alkalinization factor-like [Rhododendron vialii]|uniref:rapid alkalinization factor-like n=1 Tax=Rhododendron vialii TaxID=182163 RepID=UPI00265EDA00|nr:rapid alkalinization factor-like [Rhododendron vialii]